MSSEENSVSEKIYQLKIHLVGVSPMIWRRLLVSDQTSIAQFHMMIQIAMGWENLHLHEFTIHGKDYGIYYPHGIYFSDNPFVVLLKDFQFRPKDKFVYKYDLTPPEPWQVQIRVEKILDPEPDKTYPICVSGKHAAPPEDVYGLEEFAIIREYYDYFMSHIREISTLQENRFCFPFRPDVFKTRFINKCFQEKRYKDWDQQICADPDYYIYDEAYWKKTDLLGALLPMYKCIKKKGIEVDDGFEVWRVFFDEIVCIK